jgi:hypothetical protein
MSSDEMDLAMEAAEHNATEMLEAWKLSQHLEPCLYDCFLFGVYWAEKNLNKKSTNDF